LPAQRHGADRVTPVPGHCDETEAIYRRRHDQSLGVISVFAYDIDTARSREYTRASAKTGCEGLNNDILGLRDHA
jgi:hypothetical protein